MPVSTIPSHSCKVRDCRFKFSHVTKGHKCGRCGAYGHGEIECFNPHLKPYLAQYDDDVLPNNMICTVEDCTHKFLHTIDAHHCSRCKRRTTHTLEECPLDHSLASSQTSYISPVAILTSSFSTLAVSTCKTVKCPICRADSLMSKQPKKILGLTDKCSICLDNNVEILLTDCYHCCICNACFDRM